MTRFVAAGLDLSRLPAPQVIEHLDYEAILAARLADLKRRLEAVGIPFDVEGIESDPGVKLEETDAYRELLDRARINDAVRAVMLAFARGGDLDHLAAFYGVRRRLIRAGNPAASPPTTDLYETDEELLARAQIAPEALPVTGLTGGGYRHRALQAAPAVKDVRVIKRRDARGHPIMDVVLLARAGDGTTPPAVVDTVFRAFQDDEATQLTDVVGVRAARIVPYAITYVLRIPRGPDAALVRAESERLVRAMAADHHRIGAIVPTDAIIAAGRVRPTVKMHLTSPTADVDPGADGAAWCTGIALETEIVDV